MCPYFFAPCCTLTKPTSLRRICEAKPHKGRDALNRQRTVLSVAKADKGYARSRDVGSVWIKQNQTTRGTHLVSLFFCSLLYSRNSYVCKIRRGCFAAPRMLVRFESNKTRQGGHNLCPYFFCSLLYSHNSLKGKQGGEPKHGVDFFSFRFRLIFVRR